MAYSTTRTTTGSRLCRSLAAYSRDSHDPSERTWSTGSVGAVLPVLARHNSSAPVAAAVRHSLAPTNNRSANSSTPAKPPCSTSPSSRPASVVSPVAYEPIAALLSAVSATSSVAHPPPAAATADTTPPACPGSPAAEQPWQTAPAAAPDPAERAPAPAPTSPAASAAPQGRRGGARGGAAPPPAAAAPPGRRHQQTAPTPARNRPPCGRAAAGGAARPGPSRPAPHPPALVGTHWSTRRSRPDPPAAAALAA